VCVCVVVVVVVWAGWDGTQYAAIRIMGLAIGAWAEMWAGGHYWNQKAARSSNLSAETTRQSPTGAPIRVSFDRPISWQDTDGIASVHLARALGLWP
jgi:hypothetical protein